MSVNTLEKEGLVLHIDSGERTSRRLLTELRVYNVTVYWAWFATSQYCDAGGKNPSLVILCWFAFYDSLLNRAKVLYPVPHHSFNFFWYCLHRWEGHSWKCWQRHESIWQGTIRFFLSAALWIRSSFKRFLHCSFKVLGVVLSTKCFVLKWETACRFSTCVIRSFLYLDTDFVDILFRVPVLPFFVVPFSRVFQKRHKDIQGF